MNYLTIISRFWKLHEDIPFISDEISVFFRLISLYNKEHSAHDWAQPFECAGERLYLSVGISKNTFLAARRVLKMRGVIDFEVGKNRFQKTKYHITIGMPIESKIECNDCTLNCTLQADSVQPVNSTNSIESKIAFNDCTLPPIIKDNIDYKDYIDYISSTTRAREEKPIEKLVPNTSFTRPLNDDEILALYFQPDAPNRRDTEGLCMELHISVPELQVIGEAVLRDWRLTATHHRDRQDQLKHFIYAIRKKHQHQKNETTKRNPDKTERNAEFADLIASKLRRSNPTG